MDNLESLRLQYSAEKDAEKRKQLILNQVEFINPLGINSGVYQIENFYIGQSKGFKSRMVYHIEELLTSGKKHNINKLYLIAERLKVGKLRVTILDADVKKEPYYIDKLYNTLPLVNVEFVSIINMNIRKSADKKLAKEKEITIKTKLFLNNAVAYTTIDNRLIFRIGASVTASKKSLLKYLGQTDQPKNNNKSKTRTYIISGEGKSIEITVTDKGVTSSNKNLKIRLKKNKIN